MTQISEKTIGVILMAGFIMLVAGMFVAPSGAYEGSIDDRLAVIDANETQWVLSKVVDGLAVTLASVGLVLVAVANGRKNSGWLTMTAAISSGLAGMVGLVYIYLLATDPGPLYDRETPAVVVVGLISLLAVALAFLGVHFLRVGFPRWVGFLSTIVGVGVLLALVTIVVLEAGPEPAFGLASLMYLVILAIGIVMLRRPRTRKPRDLAR